ncbi:hypothetical protein ACFO6W_22970, partial [Dysgonomonas termitidis]
SVLPAYFFYRIDVIAETLTDFVDRCWYSALYEEGFRIFFQALDDNGRILLQRKDGIIIEELPAGYQHITEHGMSEPDERIFPE